MDRSRSFNYELSRLLAAAVVSRTFRQTLLNNPTKALCGYGSEKFDFTPAERTRILSIRAATLQEFALQAQRLIDGTDCNEIMNQTI